MVYPPVIKHGNGKSPLNGGFDRKIMDFYDPWLPARHGADETGGQPQKTIDITHINHRYP